MKLQLITLNLTVGDGSFLPIKQDGAGDSVRRLHKLQFSDDASSFEIKERGIRTKALTSGATVLLSSRVGLSAGRAGWLEETLVTLAHVAGQRDQAQAYRLCLRGH